MKEENTKKTMDKTDNSNQEPEKTQVTNTPKIRPILTQIRDNSFHSNEKNSLVVKNNGK